MVGQITRAKSNGMAPRKGVGSLCAATPFGPFRQTDSRPLFARRHRAGISLLEIMISIGIVGIGLIGVAALIPLAHYKAAQGVQEDRKTLFGKRAFREFHVRGMDRPGSIGSPLWFWDRPDGQQPFDVQGRLVRQVYCLDPAMVAAAREQGKSLYTFPSGLQCPWTVPRLTLLHSPLEMSGVQPPMMTLAQAEEVFTLRDDLALQRLGRPESATLAWLSGRDPRQPTDLDKDAGRRRLQLAGDPGAASAGRGE